MAQLTPFTSQQPIDDFGLNFSNLKYATLLAANVDTPFTVPGNNDTFGLGNNPRYKMIVVTNGTVYMSLKSLAVQPVLGGFIPSDVELVSLPKVCRIVSAGDIVHFVSPTANTPVSIILYAYKT